MKDPKISRTLLVVGILACMICGVLSYSQSAFLFTNGHINRLETSPVYASKSEIYVDFTIPAGVGETTSVFFSTSAKTEIHLAGQNGYFETKSVGGGPEYVADSWHFIDIPADSKDKPMAVSLHFGPAKPRAPVIYAGDSDYAFGRAVLKGFLMFATGILWLIVGAAVFPFLKRKNVYFGQNIGFCCFLLTGALFCFCKSGLFALFSFYTQVTGFLSYLSPFLFAASAAVFFFTILSEYKRPAAIFFLLFVLLGAAGSAGYFMKAEWTYWMTVGLYAVLPFAMGFCAYGLYKKRKETNLILSAEPIWIFLFFAFCEWVFLFILERPSFYFLQAGMFLFTVDLIRICAARLFGQIKTNEKAAYYAKIANLDLLTGGLNRNAYETALSTDTGEIRAVVIFDINNLKNINDLYGHEAGDEAICACYACILGAFGKCGKCYRIGGDEFIVLSSRAGDFKKETERLKSKIWQENEQVLFPLSLAYGVAQFDESADQDIRDTIRRADQQMYIHKNKQKTTT